jgi:hypothetical protein
MIEVMISCTTWSVATACILIDARVRVNVFSLSNEENVRTRRGVETVGFPERGVETVGSPERNVMRVMRVHACSVSE